MGAIGAMAREQKRSTVGKINRAEIWLRNTFEKHSWEIQLINTVEKYSWEGAFRRSTRKTRLAKAAKQTAPYPCLLTTFAMTAAVARYFLHKITKTSGYKTKEGAKQDAECIQCGQIWQSGGYLIHMLHLVGEYAYSLVCSAGQRGTSLGGHTCFILCPCTCLCNVFVFFNLCNGSCCLSVPVVASTVCICLIGQTANTLFHHSCIAWL